jgi:spermidine synthase
MDLKKFRSQYLLLTVFLTGAVVLVIEVVATRLLSPYFGNTIFTVSSILGIILGALSLGYYLGGLYADKKPYFANFYNLIAASGLSVILLALFSNSLLPIFAYSFSIKTGPLIFSIVLFFLPSFLLGMLSPFAIKLRSKTISKEKIGKVSGEVFFFSTAGSIVGSLLAGFVLIPNFGVDKIILTASLSLFLISFTGIAISSASKKLFLMLLLIEAFLVFFSSSEFITYPGVNIVYKKDGVYEKIVIFDITYKGQNTRFLMQDRSFSAAIYLESPDHAYDYSNYYALYKHINKNLNNALFIGGGGYVMPKSFFRELPDLKIDVVEIEPGLFDIAKKYFYAPDSERFINHVNDGRRFLHDTTNSYDFIFSDVYYSYSIPGHFLTREFFELVNQKLNTNGIFMANIIGNLATNEASLAVSALKTWLTVFPNTYIFAVGSPQNTESQNIIFVAFKSDHKLDFSGLPLVVEDKNVVNNLSDKIVDLENLDFSNQILLTDNFHPVETLTWQAVKK